MKELLLSWLPHFAGFFFGVACSFAIFSVLDWSLSRKNWARPVLRQERFYLSGSHYRRRFSSLEFIVSFVCILISLVSLVIWSFLK
jgi:hypothetical protein